MHAFSYRRKITNSNRPFLLLRECRGKILRSIILIRIHRRRRCALLKRPSLKSPPPNSCLSSFYYRTSRIKYTHTRLFRKAAIRLLIPVLATLFSRSYILGIAYIQPHTSREHRRKDVLHGDGVVCGECPCAIVVLDF